MNECCTTESGRMTIAEERRRQLLADAQSGRSPRRPSALALALAFAALALAAALLGAGCRSHPAGAALAGPQTPFPAPDAPADAAYLEDALAQMPADAARFAFTDWRRVRGYHDFQGNSQRTGRDRRVAYMLNVMKMTQAAAQMDSAYFLFQAQKWGWDSTDLLWEAQAHWQWLTDSVFILRFRDDFDFAPLRALLEERSFTAAGHRDATIHSAPLDHNPDWHFRSHLAHHAIAILPAEGLLIMAPTPAPIHRVLAVRDGADGALLEQPAVAGVVDALRHQAAVEMYLGANVCRRFGRGQTPSTALGPYTLLAAAYLDQGRQQRDLLLFHYENGRQAAADLDGRRAILESGVSPRRDVAYGKEFTVEEAAVDGRLLRFRLAPTAALRRATGWPQTLLGWVQDGDARFAACAAR